MKPKILTSSQQSRQVGNIRRDVAPAASYSDPGDAKTAKVRRSPRFSGVEASFLTHNGTLRLMDAARRRFRGLRRSMWLRRPGHPARVVEKEMTEMCLRGHSSLVAVVRSRPGSRLTASRTSHGLPFGAVAMLAVALLAGGSGHARAEVETTTDAERISLWDRPVEGTNLSFAEITIEGKSPDEVEPVLLPLPAPALAAGVGLGLAWVIRRRFDRR